MKISINNIDDNYQHIMPDTPDNITRITSHGAIKPTSYQNISSQSTNIDASEKNYKSYPLTKQQQGLWFNYKLNPKSNAYNTYSKFHIKGDLDIDKFRKAINMVGNFFSTFRTKFIEDKSGVAKQIISPELEGDILEYEDISNNNLSKKAKYQLALEKIKIKQTKSFELKKDYGYRTYLIKYSDNNYIFVITKHHILSDGVGGLLINEAISLACNKGRQALGERFKKNYDVGDYFKKCEDLKEQENLAKTYWKSRLKGSNLIIDIPGKINQKFSMQEQRFSFGEDRYKKIKKYAKENGTTTFLVLSTIYATLIFRYFGQKDMLIGYPVNIRPQDFKDIFGHYVSLYPLRIQIDEKDKFKDLINKITLEQKQDRKHFYLGMDEIANLTDTIHHGISKNFNISIAQGMFVHKSLTMKNLDIDIELDTQIEHEDLNLLFDPQTENLDFKLGYNANLFTQKNISAFIKHYHNLVDIIIENDCEKIIDLNYLDKDETTQLLVEYNNTKSPYPKNKCIHELFEEQVIKSPNKAAIIFEDKQLTYKELDQKSSELAKYLQNIGVKPDSLVGLYVERSLEMIIGIMGILKAGGAYVPLDPDYPNDRLEYMIDDGNLNIILTQKKLKKQIDEVAKKQSTQIIDIDDFEKIKNIANNQKLKREAKSNSLAYIIYTSGSTGKPKGVMVEHKNLVNHNKDIIKSYQICNKDIVLQCSTFAFDIFAEEVFPSLIAGSSLLIMKKDNLLNEDQFCNYILKHKATIINIPTALLHHMSNCKLPSQVRLAITGGEKLDKTHYEMWQEYNDIKLINAYGPSECTITSTLYECTNNIAYNNVPIGKPIANTQTYILDKHLNPVPKGVVGELHIAGDGVARGYLNREDLTKEKFIKNIFSDDPKSRMYKTGDLARYLEDGNIEYIGRIDSQVKIRGFRIELGEIEQELLKIDGIREAVVLVKWYNNNKMLVAYIATKNNQVNINEIKTTLEKKLPNYMVPSTFITKDSLPLTSNGKIDKKALANLDLDIRSTDEYVAPRNEVEKKLAIIFKEVLGVNKVGVCDNFFEIGGDSILSIQIVSKAKKYGLYLSVQDIFNYQTIDRLALNCKKEALKTTAKQETLTGEIPLLPIQKWFFENQFNDQNHWNQSVILELKERVSFNMLKQAMEYLINHHDILKCHYTNTNNSKIWHQSYSDKLPKNVVDYCDLRNITNQQLLKSSIEKECNLAQNNLNIEKGILIKTLLFDTPNNKNQRLFITIHHLAVDVVSWRILLEDLNNTLISLQLNKTIDLPDKTNSYRDWSEKLLTYSKSSEIKKEIPYWKNQSSQSPTSLIQNQEFQKNNYYISDTKTIRLTLGQKHTNQLLQECHKSYNTQINDLLLTALIDTYSKWSDEKELVLDLEGHGRNEMFDDIDLSRTVGWFTTIYPVKLVKSKDSNMGHLIKQTKEILRKIPNKGIGYGILRYLSQNKIISENDKRIISFNYLGQLDNITTNKEKLFQNTQEKMGDMISPKSKCNHLLDINGYVILGKLNLDIRYISKLFSEKNIKEFSNLYKKSLINIIKHCQGNKLKSYTPSDFGLTSITQKELDKFNNKRSKIQRNNISSIYPLSPMQRGLLFENFVSKETYTLSIVINLKGEVNIQAMRKSWQFIVNHYDILRTIIVNNISKEPLQIVLKEVAFDIKILDLRNKPDYIQKRELENLVTKGKQKGFDLEKAPLMRVTLIRINNDEYKLLWENHHIILDGWSNPIFLKSLMQAYQSYLKNEVPNLPIPAKYESYIGWLQKQNTDKARIFWQKYLLDYEGECDLPINLNSKKLIKPKNKFGEYSHKLNYKITSNINLFLRKKRITLGDILQVSWAILLSKYNSKEDVVFGNVSSGRSGNLSQIEELVGLCINTLPIRVNAKGENTIEFLLKEMNKSSVTVREYEYSSLTDIQKWLKIKNNNELFQTIFVLENYPMKEIANQKDAILKVDGFESHETPHYPLSLTCIPGEELEIKITYDKHYYDEIFVKKLSNHYKLILDQIISNTSQKIKDISLLEKKEATQLLVEYNNTKAFYPKDKCLHELFEEQVKKTPNIIAVIFEDQKLTYKELNQKSNVLAIYLQNLGVKPDSLVGICTERSLEMIIGIMGILKAGGAYVPLDPEYPNDRLKYMIDDGNLNIILTQNKLKKQINEITKKKPTQIINIDDFEKIKNVADNKKLKKEVKSNNLAYIIYTSGSTGKPKGVMVEHNQIINTLFYLENKYPVQPGNSYLLKTNYVFDVSLSELFGWFIGKGRLVILSPKYNKIPSKIIETITKNNVTHVNFVPPLLNSLVNELNTNNGKMAPSLKYIMVAGEVFIPELLRKTQGLLADQQIENIYGPTETSIYGCGFSCPKNKIFKTNIPIGKPISNTQLYILDKHLNPVPKGVVGELHIAGDGVARGYLNREDLTKEKFIKNIFSDDPKSRMYKTGDLARYLEDGNIEYIGRIDSQVKIRGFRIELGEIEQELLKIDGIREAVVLVKWYNNNKMLVAYIATKNNQVNINEIKTTLEKKLPNYMVPSTFITKDSLPLTSNGKIDKKALANLDLDIRSTDEYVAPRNEVEKKLAIIFKEVLGVNKVGVCDNFFEIGGNSLLVTNLVAKVNNEFKKQKIEIATLFLNPNIDKLAKCIKSNKTESINKEITLKNELKLAEEIPDQCHKKGNYKNPRNILITGSTGFVGTYLLQNLLSKTTADLYCLVRGNSKIQCKNKIEESFKKYQIKLTKSNWDRIKVIKGNLEKEKLGIDSQEYQILVNNVDIIIHSGAFVNHLYSYKQLKKANVSSTYELIKMAKTHLRKKLIFISTTSVINDPNQYKNGENTNIESFKFKETDGYVGGKWVSEMMIKNANIDYQIHRISRAGGNVTSNIGPMNDLSYRYWKTCLMLKKYPKEFESWQEDIRPIDQIVEIISFLMMKSDLNNNVFHLNNNKTISINKPLEVSKNSTTLSKIDLEEWIELLKKGKLNGKNLPFYPYLNLIKPALKSFKNQDDICNKNTMNLIPAKNRIFEFNDKQLGSYVKQCIEG